MWGELEEEQGVLSMFTDTREASVAGGWSGKASDTCWMREVVGGRGTGSHRTFGLSLKVSIFFSFFKIRFLVYFGCARS